MPTSTNPKYSGASARMAPAIIGCSARLMKYKGMIATRRFMKEKKVSTR